MRRPAFVDPPRTRRTRRALRPGPPWHHGPVNEVLVETVLRLVESVPAGRVTTYGRLAALAGTGPRVVARIVAEWGSSTPWWRVVNTKGQLPPHLRAVALEHWLEEGTPLGGGVVVEDSRYVDVRAALVDERSLEATLERIVAELRE